MNQIANLLKTTTLLFALILFFFTSCHPNATTQDANFLNYVYKNIDFSMTKKQVKKIETTHLQKETGNVLVYTFDITKESFGDITYTFDKSSKLTKIELDLFTPNKTTMSFN